MKRFSIILFIFLTLMCQISIATADYLSVEPTNSWVYESLNLLYHYNPPNHYIDSRPLWRMDISEYIKDLEITNNRIAMWERDRILEEYATIPHLPDVSHYNSTAWLKISSYSMNTFEDHDKPLFRLGFIGEGVFTYGDNFFAQLRGRFGNRTYLDSFAEVRKWSDDAAGYFDYGLIGLKHKSFRFTLGRTFRTFGPWDNDRLLISTNSPAFNQISAEFHHKWFKFQFFTSQLDFFYDPDDSARINRFYAAHRISVKPHHRLELGISETVLYGRKEGSWELRYLNPILPFYVEQWNSFSDDNLYMGLDFTWIVKDGLILFGELLIDDFQIDFVTEPNQVGFNFGLSEVGLLLSDRLQFQFDYTQIRNTVYGQNRFYNVYANERVVIGSSLGTDADRLRSSLTMHFCPRMRASLGGEYSRKGEGRYYYKQSTTVEKGQKFPSGRVQKNTDFFVNLDFDYNTGLLMNLKFGYRDVINVNNTEEGYNTFYIKFNLSYNLRFGFLL